MYMYVCVYIYIYTHIHIHIYVYTHSFEILGLWTVKSIWMLEELESLLRPTINLCCCSRLIFYFWVVPVVVGSLRNRFKMFSPTYVLCAFAERVLNSAPAHLVQGLLEVKGMMCVCVWERGRERDFSKKLKGPHFWKERHKRETQKHTKECTTFLIASF